MPKVIWIIDPEQWPRALLRAELLERGYDAAGFLTVDDALRVMPMRWPDLIVADLRHLTREEAARLFGAKVPVIGLAGVAPEPWVSDLPFAAVLTRPVSLGEIADRVARLANG
jgi:DNA-binding NtrC family response regulator